MKDVERLLAPFAAQLGDDRSAYTNHVVRVLEFCDALHVHYGGDAAERPSTKAEFVIAGAFHDLGVWTVGTFDYLAPSIDLARDHLAEHARTDLEPVVVEMIDLHHKVRVAGERLDPVELFRRADTIDASKGLRRFGLPRREYRRIAERYPNAGFHRALVRLGAKRIRTHPTSPFPMMRW